MNNLYRYILGLLIYFVVITFLKINMDNCIFCKIIKGEIPSYKVYEDENYLGILDIAQFVEGHTIVIPKKHHEFVWDVEDLKYFEVVRKIANHYRRLGYKYVDSAVFGRMVPHAHIHLVPHNEDGNDWDNSLEKIGDMQKDKSRWPSKDKGEELVNRFKFPN